jgi:hypothetical protein
MYGLPTFRHLVFFDQDALPHGRIGSPTFCLFHLNVVATSADGPELARLLGVAAFDVDVLAQVRQEHLPLPRVCPELERM